RWISKLGMTRILGKTNIDFLRKRFVAGVASVLLIGLGLFGVNYRGEDLLDIDLRGGVRIEVVFNDATTDRVVYEALENNEDLQDLQVIGSSEDSTSFFVETTQEKLKDVEDAVKEAFGDKLKTNSLRYDAAAIMPIADSAVTVESDTSDPAAPPAEEGPAKSPPEDAGGQPDEKPADEKPADEKPVDEKPAAEDPPTPGENDGARADLPSRSLIALAQPDSEDSAVETDAEPAAVAEPAPAEGATPPAAVEGDSPPGAAEPPSEAEDADVPQAGNESPGEEPAAQPIDIAAAPSAPATRFAGGCEVPLVFADEISEGTLTAKLTDVIAANNEIKTPDMEVTNREVKPDSNVRKHEWTLRSTMTMGQTKDVLDQLQSQLAVEPHFPTAETIGTQVAGDTQTQGLAAIIASLVFIVTYIWIRFQQVSYGLAAVVALVHDVLITLGLIALSTFVANIPGVSNVLQLESFKISLPMLAAFLTIIGYSLNDTIVVFDRIREVKGKSPRLTSDIVNTSINQTLSRTLLTSFTTLIVVLILYFVGGPGIHGFAFALVIGVLVGTYSSIFVASPALLWMRRFGAGAKSPSPAARGEATAAG
ncbi:MAG: protein translocase subunit SecF, partial [Planctomycetota bacterium]|nr:protein translocase subunit SecF [Planctomycetota bacterium]